ncbi:MAG: hypothetical protein FWG74_06005 [Planctomycetes bacterium]|nr:hypothetical protein [Planctomycetota bacterium]
MFSPKRFVKSTAFAFVVLLPAVFASAGEKEAGKPHMMYFYNPACRLCTGANEVVGKVEEKFDGSMTHQRFNIADQESGVDNVLYMFELMDALNVPEDGNVTLAVFFGFLEEEDGEIFFTPRHYLLDGEEIIQKLEEMAEKFLGTKGEKPSALRPGIFFSSGLALASAAPETPPAETRPVVRPRIRPAADGAPSPASDGGLSRAQAQLQFWTISLAALADSVNPCAFATIIILVAMMSTAKRNRKEIIAVCLAFTASVYLTYFAIGLFLYRIISEINQQGGTFLVVADLIYYLAFALCLIFGVLSLYDAYLLFSGRAAEEMTLQLPQAFKKRINVAMARGVRARWLILGVFVAGVTVSFFEAACTGQVYLPIIIALAKMDFWHSVIILAWYNFLFVLPLLIIFGAVLWGVTSQQLTGFFKKNVAWTKVALALVFIIMGVILWYEIRWPPGYRG